VLDRTPDAVLDMVLEEDDADLLRRGDDAADLREDVDAVGLLVHHPLQPPDLTLDPLEAVLQLLLALGPEVSRRVLRYG
jgi:hypothetical protein